MNIFYFTNNPTLNAKLLDDKRLIKMVLETTQLLSNGLYLNNQNAPYKPTHLKHPCSIWSARCKANWEWLKKYGLELAREYTKRYGKIHKCESVIRFMVWCIKSNNNIINNIDANNSNNIITNENSINTNYNIFEQPPQCMPEQYKCNKTTIAYMKYYIGEKFNLKYFNHTCEKVINFWEKLKKNLFCNKNG